MSFIIKAVHWDEGLETVVEYFCNVQGKHAWDGDDILEIPQCVIKYHSRDEAVIFLGEAVQVWLRDWEPFKPTESIRIGDKILISASLLLGGDPTLIKISVEELED